MSIENLNILGTELELCCDNPLTGFLRNGFCSAHNMDTGEHLVCAIMTEEFLNFSKARGNDLSTPRPEFGFPGLQPGDQWCLCAGRWKEAHIEHVAPPIRPEATHARALERISLNDLLAHRVQ
jgi:uncharacterized protein (DUF2237 family)